MDTCVLEVHNDAQNYMRRSLSCCVAALFLCIQHALAIPILSAAARDVCAFKNIHTHIDSAFHIVIALVTPDQVPFLHVACKIILSRYNLL